MDKGKDKKTGPSKLEQIRALGSGEIGRRYVPDHVRSELRRVKTRATEVYVPGGGRRRKQPKPVTLAGSK